MNEKLETINTEIQKLPPNSTDKTQALDSDIISEFKSMWRREWDTERNRRIELNLFSSQSGKVKHPDRQWYMWLAIRCVDKINSTFDSSGISLPRKAMIRTGLSLDADGN